MKKTQPPEDIAVFEDGKEKIVTDIREEENNKEKTEQTNTTADITKHQTANTSHPLRKYKRRKRQQTLYLGQELLDICDTTRKSLGLSRSEFFRYCVLKTLDSLGILPIKPNDDDKSESVHADSTSSSNMEKLPTTSVKLTNNEDEEDE